VATFHVVVNLTNSRWHNSYVYSHTRHWTIIYIPGRSGRTTTILKGMGSTQDKNSSRRRGCTKNYMDTMTCLKKRPPSTSCRMWPKRLITAWAVITRADVTNTSLQVRTATSRGAFTSVKFCGDQCTSWYTIWGCCAQNLYATHRLWEKQRDDGNMREVSRCGQLNLYGTDLSDDSEYVMNTDIGLVGSWHMGSNMCLWCGDDQRCTLFEQHRPALTSITT
jgi:hypothetical protein